jgi:hypothetical protein
MLMADDKPPRRYGPMTYTATRRVWSDERIIAEYAAGKSCDDIGYEGGLHAQTARKILRAHGVELRPPNRARRNPRVIPEEEAAEIIRRYLAGATGPALATAYGVALKRIYAVMDERGVHRRSSGAFVRQRRREKQAEREARTTGRRSDG